MRSFWSNLPRPFFALAPMEDVTDTSFRRLVRTWSQRWGSSGPTVMFSEFTRADAAIRSTPEKPDGRLRYTAEERPLVAQIWGTRPEEFRLASEALHALGFDGVDINMGCPAWKIRKAGACSALIGNRRLAAELIAACREGSDLPISVKTRIGITVPETESWCRFLLEQEVEAITLHPRVADQMSEGWADWREVRRVVDLRDRIGVPTAIIGNGDVCSLEHALRLVEQTGVEGVMIGRGIFYDPLLFARVGDTPPPSWEEIPLSDRVSYLAEHMREYHREWKGRRSFEVLKKFYRNYFLPGDSREQAILRRLYTFGTPAKAIALLREEAGLPEGPGEDLPEEDELPEDLFGEGRWSHYPEEESVVSW
ncbi:MAG: tRNA-dihydrouridine synthase family protein [Spirochaetaceae bacterium]|nr:MAG: tRNA-dihydrouridine synthase family protein [Spirochaetaceae bacterium]